MIECKMIQGDSDPSIQDAYYVRDLVFTQEQGYPTEIEIDDYDKIAWHCIFYKDGAAMGTARLIPQDRQGKIGRVAVLKEFRGLGLGFKIMEAILDQAHQLSYDGLSLSAQVYAVPFYEKLGFSVVGEEYLEDGEPHINMVKVLTA